jgi:hypothetical protein
MPHGLRWWIVSVSFALATSSCKSKQDSSPAAVASAAPSASASARLPPPERRDWPQPSGPVLAVLAGRGVGPIRFGATIPTIERLMDLPCPIKSEDFCRYPNRGVEFLLEGGALKTVHIYRAGRPAGTDASGKPAEYGFFRGGLPPDLQLGMIPSALQEHLGQPKRIEQKPDVPPGPAEAVETHEYPGLTLVYDRLENGNLVLAEIVVTSDPNAPPLPPSVPSAAPGKAPPKASAAVKAPKP